MASQYVWELGQVAIKISDITQIMLALFCFWKFLSSISRVLLLFVAVQVPYSYSCGSTDTWGQWAGKTIPPSFLDDGASFVPEFNLCFDAKTERLADRKKHRKSNIIENQSICGCCHISTAITLCNWYLLQNDKLKQKKLSGAGLT